jgi:hypothetical protein
LTVLPTTTLVDDNHDESAHDKYGINNETASDNTMGSFESCKREAAALERLLEDKVSRYQQVG